MLDEMCQTKIWIPLIPVIELSRKEDFPNTIFHPGCLDMRNMV